MKINVKAVFTVILLAVATGLLMAATGRINHAAQNVVARSGMPLKVVVDAGHGGVDGGAVSGDGYTEKDVNLKMAQKLKNILNTLGFQVIMVREEDVSIHDPSAVTVKQKKTSDLHNRLKMIENNPDALFISIHQNHFSQRSANGTQVFYSPGDPASKDLAQSIQQTVKSLLQPQNGRVIKKSTNDIYILHKARTPAVMVECGFLSNPAESVRLRNDEYQNKMAFCIAMGILEFASAEPMVKADVMP